MHKKSRLSPDHPAYEQSIIQAFVLHWCILSYPMIWFMDSKDPDQTAHPYSLIWALAVSACTEGNLCLEWLIWYTVLQGALITTKNYLLGILPCTLHNEHVYGHH